jgi:hypothetical protein
MVASSQLVGCHQFCGGQMSVAANVGVTRFGKGCVSFQLKAHRQG